MYLVAYLKKKKSRNNDRLSKPLKVSKHCVLFYILFFFFFFHIQKKKEKKNHNPCSGSPHMFLMLREENSITYNWILIESDYLFVKWPEMTFLMTWHFINKNWIELTEPQKKGLKTQMILTKEYFFPIMSSRTWVIVHLCYPCSPN